MFKLRYYQDESVDRTIRYIKRDPTKSPLIAQPTGSGKTPIIAELINQLDDYVLVISHVKEILQQNYTAITKHMPNADVGINSAGLGRREISDITVASIQSIWRTPEAFKDFKYIIVDECHLIPNDGEGMYNSFLEGMKHATIIGLTATPFRLGWGYIYGKDRMFDDLVIDYTQGAKFVKLIEEGYLSPLSTKATKVRMDTDDVKMVGGDFDSKQLAKKFDTKAVTDAAIKEVIDRASDRKKWLVFAIDIDHAEHIAETLLRAGIKTMIVHSKMEFDRDTVIKMFKDGKYQAIVNVNVLTTGFDVPDIDLIVGLRPTMSVSLYIQMTGRGLRIAEGKKDCLVMDFAGNTARLGPINDVKIRNKGERRETNADPITKECPVCNEVVHPSVRVCPSCGHKFEFKTNIESKHSDLDIVSVGKEKKPKWFQVEKVTYAINHKSHSPSSVLVTYWCSIMHFKEWVCIEHSGYAKHKANHWIDQRGGIKCETVEDLMKIKDTLKKPNRIRVDKSGKYNSIIDYSF